MKRYALCLFFVLFNIVKVLSCLLWISSLAFFTFKQRNELMKAYYIFKILPNLWVTLDYIFLWNILVKISHPENKTVNFKPFHEQALCSTMHNGDSNQAQVSTKLMQWLTTKWMQYFVNEKLICGYANSKATLPCPWKKSIIYISN